MNYFDLNIPYVDSDTLNASLRNTRLKTVVKAMELGYTGVAYNRSIKQVISDKDICTIHRFPLPSLLKLSPNLSSSVKFHRELLGVRVDSPFRQYTRLTVFVDDTDQFGSLNSRNLVVKSYDLVAVRPLNQDTFNYACIKAEVDIIAIDFTNWVPFMIKYPMVEAALKRGVHFEITYSPLIGDVQLRKQVVHSTKTLVQWTRGKNLILSSAAASATEIRGPSDVANLSSLLGISIERAKAAISKNCRCLLTNAVRKKQYYQSAIKVDRILTTDPVDSTEAWFCDGHGWDDISSGNGDLLLDDIAKSFAASSKIPESSKPIDVALNSNQGPSYGVQVLNPPYFALNSNQRSSTQVPYSHEGCLRGSGSQVHSAFNKSPPNDFGVSSSTVSFTNELKSLGGVPSAGGMSVDNTSSKNSNSARRNILKASSGSNCSEVIMIDKEIEGFGTSFEEGKVPDEVVPVAGEMLSHGKSSEECEYKGAHVTELKDVQAFEIHEYTTGSSNLGMMSHSLINISSNENNPVVALYSGKNSVSSDEMPPSSCCNENVTKTCGVEVEMAVDDVTMMGVLNGREENGNSDMFLDSCDMPMDRGNIDVEKLGQCKDLTAPHLDNRIMGASSYDRQSDANHSVCMSPQGVPYMPRITSGRSKSRHRRYIPALQFSRRHLFYSTLLNKKNCSRKRKSNENNWESGIDSNMKDRFIELCLQELDNSGKLGETLKSSSWMHIAKEIKHDFGDCYSVSQLNKKMKVMEKQYQICASITNKIGHCYDATGSSKISSPEMREKYQKVRSVAKEFSF